MMAMEINMHASQSVTKGTEMRQETMATKVTIVRRMDGSARRHQNS